MFELMTLERLFEFAINFSCQMVTAVKHSLMAALNATPPTFQV